MITLDYAKKRLDEAIRNGTQEDIYYWRGYRDAVKACNSDDNKCNQYETVKDKICPLTHALCKEAHCAWWCGFAQDCAVPLLAGMFADSDVCQTRFVVGEKQ